jgi:hypothetical protein
MLSEGRLAEAGTSCLVYQHTGWIFHAPTPVTDGG